MTAQFMASHKGATGPVCATPIEAATAFGARYPKVRACRVNAVTDGPVQGTVTVAFRSGFYDYVMRKGVPHIA